LAVALGCSHDLVAADRTTRRRQRESVPGQLGIPTRVAQGTWYMPERAANGGRFHNLEYLHSGVTKRGRYREEERARPRENGPTPGLDTLALGERLGRAGRENARQCPARESHGDVEGTSGEQNCPGFDELSDTIPLEPHAASSVGHV
jgi:hypothetical protein